MGIYITKNSLKTKSIAVKLSSIMGLLSLTKAFPISLLFPASPHTFLHEYEIKLQNACHSYCQERVLRNLYRSHITKNYENTCCSW